jgi:subtilisin family serine protease
MRFAASTLVLFTCLSLAAQSRPERQDVLVLLREQADLSLAEQLPTKEEKGRFVFDTLVRTAQRTQGALVKFLEERGASVQRFYIANVLRVVADPATLELVAARPDVWKIELNPRVSGLVHSAQRGGGSDTSFAIEPGVSYINAPQVWALGFDGTGVVVGAQDTGYQWDHPALKLKYRGWNASTSTANHDYNWHDAIHSGGGGCGANAPAPCDDNSHGTHTIGTVLGDDGGGNQIGVAPGAKFICARNMDQGNGTPATYIECFEFFLAPYPVGGNPLQGNPLLAPHVTTNSWACPPSEGCSPTALLLACQAQRAAGIITVGAAGNSGSSCSSCADPLGIYDEVWTVGAISSSTGNIASFSSRGPVTSDGSNRMKPDISAPGVSVRSSVPGNGYAGGWSGTSMATPHAAGAVALLLSAHPALKGQVQMVENILNASATHVNTTACNGGGTWPNNVYGHGVVDALAAVNSVRGVTATPNRTTASMGAGQTAHFVLGIQNTGWLPDTYTLSISGGTFVSSVPTTVGPIAGGSSAQVTVNVAIPLTAVLGQSSSLQVTITSLNWSQASLTTVPLVTTVGAPAPVITLSQPAGAGTGLVMQAGGLIAGHDYHTIISGELCPLPGAGPYLGLCSTDFNFLLMQFSLPAGVLPFHFIASGTSLSMGPWVLPAGLSLDVLCFEVTASGFGAIGEIARYTTF